MQTKRFVLLSGGIDSSTCMGIAQRDARRESRDAGIDWGHALDIVAVSVDYGQRHSRELESAKAVAEYYGAEHRILQLPRGTLGGMLASEEQEVPNCGYEDITGVSPTYVTFRNGTMLSLLAAEANKWTAEDKDERRALLYYGAHAEDAAGFAYPDCTAEFNGAMAAAISIGTYYTCSLQTPLQFLTKDDIVKLGTELNVPYELTWSCYKGQDIHCGDCPTCRSRHSGFSRLGLNDPTEYAINSYVWRLQHPFPDDGPISTDRGQTF